MSNPQVSLADDELLVRDQICERLKISRRKLWELERAEKAPPRIELDGAVRYPKSLFDKFLQEHYQAAVDSAAA